MDKRVKRQPEIQDDTSSYEARARVIEEHLESLGVLNTEEVDRMTAMSPSDSKFIEGRRVVARAWNDPAFKARLLSDGTAAIGELGFQIEPGHQSGLQLCVVENCAEVHNVIVCTLCSCYPRALLGAPPAWYMSEAYRAGVVRDPVGVLKEFGLDLGPDVTIRVWDSTAQTRYMVLPQRPEGTDGWSNDELVKLVTPNALIGTALAERLISDGI